MLHIFLAVLLLFFDSSRAQTLSCSTNVYTTRVTKANSNNFVCKREICFGGSGSTPASFDLSSTEAANIESLACGYNADRLKQTDCSAPLIQVSGRTCPVCTCNAVDSVKWHEQVSTGRRCQLYRCSNLTSSRTTCNANDKLGYLPGGTSFVPQGSTTSELQGVYLPTSTVLHTASLRTSYTEFNTVNYSCPMAEVCKTLPNPQVTLPNNVLGYARGTYYTERSNTSCLIDFCSGTAWTSWDFQTGELTPNQLNFVKGQCPSSSYLRFQRCYNGNGKMYFEFVTASSCRTRNSFCNMLYCECPAANRNTPWYERRQIDTSVPSRGISTTPVPSYYISGKEFSCQRYSCRVRNISATIRNIYYVEPVVLSSVKSSYGPVSPCDASVGHSAQVGEYYRSSTALNPVLSKLPMQRRSPAILIFQSLQDPFLVSLWASQNPIVVGQSYQTAISNATCKMLGTADCYEVKTYDVAKSTQTRCPELGKPSTTVQSCSTLGSNCVDTQTQPGQFINTRIQCFGTRENFVMKPVCKKNLKMQMAYENLDRCFNNMNYVLNVRSKVIQYSGNRCTISDFYTRWLREGQCDHPVIRQFLTHTAGCYCSFVNAMSTSDTPGTKQSAQALFDDVLNSRTSFASATYGEYANDLWRVVNDLASYGCTVVPFRCSGGSVSYTIRRPTMSGSFKVKTSCKHVVVDTVRSGINSFLSVAGVASSGYKSQSLRITNLINGTNECTLRFSAFVRNRVWAEYLQRNTSQLKPLNGFFNSLANRSIILDGVGSAVSASPSSTTFNVFALLALVAALF